jgi:YD repeat-containing protein
MGKLGVEKYPFFAESKRLFKAFHKLLVILFICLIAVSVALADEVTYFYDDAGRLVRVADPSTNAQVLYQYDEVGNLLGISSGTFTAGPPVLDNITPGFLVKGSKAFVSITGQNLITTKELSSDNPDITIYVLSVSDAEIKAAVIIPLSAVSGAVHFTAVTLYGSDSIQASITDATLHFSPEYIALSPGISGTITANISPPVNTDITIILHNSNPTIALAPRFFTIISSGISDFSIDPFNAGYSTISSGEAETIVNVTESTIANSLPVSIFKEQEQVNTSFVYAMPLSIYYEPQAGISTVNAFPVSVYRDLMQSIVTFQALPVSAYRETGYGNPVVVTLPVSTQISVQ